MADYSEPVTPAEVCERIRETLTYRVKQLRRDAEILHARADEIEIISRDVVFNEKRLYEQYQPITEAGQSAPETVDNGRTEADRG